jgi:hypothetical protein
MILIVFDCACAWWSGIATAKAAIVAAPAILSILIAIPPDKDFMAQRRPFRGSSQGGKKGGRQHDAELLFGAAFFCSLSG